MTTKDEKVGDRSYMKEKDGRRRVAVFVGRTSRGYIFTAYLRDYNATWSGCNVVEVSAQNGADAKKIAIAKVKAMMLSDERVNIYDC